MREHPSFLVDGSGTVLAFDAAMETLTGWQAARVVGRHKDRFGSSRPLYEGTVPVPMESESFALRLHSRNGRILDVEARATRVPGTGDRVAVSVLRVHPRPEAEPPAGPPDIRDPLTGLMDRAIFLAHLTSDLQAASGRPVALILADVDHMRFINDRVGRQAGDEVLRKLGRILRSAVSDEHRLARLGDDDFGIALTGQGREEVREVAGRLRSTVERFGFFALRPDRNPVRVTLSLGSASYPADAKSELELIDRAQEALAQARLHGRNRVWCYTRRPRMAVRLPVYYDGAEPLLVGIARDLSPSGIFVQTPLPLGAGTRCALAFPLPGWEGNVHVIGRVVRAVPPRSFDSAVDASAAGMAIEFERVKPEDGTAIEVFLRGGERPISPISPTSEEKTPGPNL